MEENLKILLLDGLFQSQVMLKKNGLRIIITIQQTLDL